MPAKRAVWGYKLGPDRPTIHIYDAPEASGGGVRPIQRAWCGVRRVLALKLVVADLADPRIKSGDLHVCAGCRTQIAGPRSADASAVQIVTEPSSVSWL
jgi:hypothetical protein